MSTENKKRAGKGGLLKRLVRHHFMRSLVVIVPWSLYAANQVQIAGAYALQNDDPLSFFAEIGFGAATAALLGCWYHDRTRLERLMPNRPVPLALSARIYAGCATKCAENKLLHCAK